PLPIMLAHQLAERLALVRRSLALPYLRPDGKSQVTVLYEDGRPVSVASLVISAQHDPDVAQAELHADLEREVVQAVVPEELLQDTRVLINPTGRFVVGGPQADAGLTGR